MLCDDLVTILERSRKVSLARADPAHPDPAQTDPLGAAEAARNMADATRQAQRFVLSPLTVETASQLAVDIKAVGRTRDYLFTPAQLTWIEWTGAVRGGHPRATRHGFLLIGQAETKTNLVAGWGAYVYADPAAATTLVPMPLTYDFPAERRGLLQWIGGGPFDLADVSPDGWTHASQINTAGLGAFLGAALALINTPRLSYAADRDLDALNRARARLNRPPYLSYKDVMIAIDRSELGLGTQRNMTGERALHHVRTFLRLKRGRVELVRPHWRGNPRFGVIRHRYLAFRAEDEPGPWSGGPMPDPQMIDAMTDSEPSDD